MILQKQDEEKTLADLKQKTRTITEVAMMENSRK